MVIQAPYSLPIEKLLSSDQFTDRRVVILDSPSLDEYVALLQGQVERYLV